MENINLVMGRNLRKLRKKFNLYQEDIACTLGITVTSVSRIERGIVPLRPHHIETLCKTYDVKYKFFFIDNNDKDENKDDEKKQDKELDNTNAINALLRNSGGDQEKLLQEMQTLLNYLHYRYGQRDD